jgi:hypothetical protein
MNILVADKLAEEGLEFLKQSGMPFDVKLGLTEDQLAAAVGAYDALIVRSGAKVTAKVLESPASSRPSPAPASAWTTSTSTPPPPRASSSSTPPRPARFPRPNTLWPC